MKLEENSQGFFRVVLPNGNYLMDIDLMSGCTGSFVSGVMTYGSREAALTGYAYYEQLRARTGIAFTEVYIANDFKTAKE